MSIDVNKLLISSDFYSVQGEGKSSGVPSYFVRLGTCNLTCGMSRKFTNNLLKEQSLEDGEIFVGDLQAEGKATWTCDSTSQWLWRGEEKDPQYLIDRWKEEGVYEDIRNGTIHIIWTGGEPTLPKHQEAIYNFLNYWDKVDPIKPGVLGKTPFNEIETNGTCYIGDDLFFNLDQINCSPKLSNSGMTEKQRIVPHALKRIMEHSNYQFKFVISNEEDVQELFRDFVVPFNIPLKNVVCMPGMDSQEQYHERTHFILEMAKKYKFRGLSRLHISAYDKTLNV
jgi:organic radical activating enzyme